MRALALSPHGLLYLDPTTDGGVPVRSAARIEAAFGRSPGAGLLHLGAVEFGVALPPSHTYFRELGRDVVTALAAEPDLETLREAVALAPRADVLGELAASAPPMRGAEYVDAELLARLWQDALGAFRDEIARHEGTVASYLHGKNAVWNLVGRVFFHLAENKRDTSSPFSFLATYTTRLSAGAKPQHRPLGSAFDDFARAGDKKGLLSLLRPVHRAAEASALVRGLVESRELYRPLVWTPEQAHAFLAELPALEASGVIARVPDWWNARRPPRVSVRVTLGDDAPPLLDAEGLLDFRVDVAAGGETLSAAETRALLRSTGSLALIKGRWVEVDRERLAAVMDRWKTAERAAERGGVSFIEAMRMLAGVRQLAAEEAGPEEDDGWSRVEAGAWLASTLEGLRSPEALAELDPGPALRAELRPYQRVGVRWLGLLQRLGLGGCLADDMGLGKTVQVLALLLVLKKGKPERPSLLVVPASLLGNWTAEAARFAPDLRLHVAHPSAPGGTAAPGSLAKVDLVLTTYGTLLRAGWITGREWNLAVLDEAQAVKNPSAKQTRAVKKVRARTRLALTGTPIENHLGDLWSLFDFLAPGLLGSEQQFGKVQRALAKRDHAAYQPLRDLLRPYVLRRLKTDRRVIADLPDKTEVVAHCHLTKVQAALYAEAVADLAHKLESADGMARRGAILASLTRMKQICNHPSHWLGDGGWDPKASGKLLRLRELCEPLAERQDKVLVFTQYREVIDPLARELGRIFGRDGLALHGGTPVRERQRLVDAFQQDAGPPFFVLSLKAGGTGLNLTAASHVIHFDRWWNPAVESQATDRAFRIGQKRNVMVHKMVVRGTVEERIDALLARKKGLSEAVLEGGGESFLTEMSNEELLRMVSLDLTAALAEAS